jgi:hypothetical protein
MSSLVVFFLGLLLDDFHHLLFDLLFFEDESVFIPDEVGSFEVESVSLHAALEKADDVGVIWVLSETECSAVVHEFSELFRLVLAQFFHGHFFLLFFDVGIFLLLGSAWKSLPWKRSLQEVQQHVTNGFQIVSSGLLVADVSVDTRVSGGTCQVLSVSEWNVLTVRTLVAFGQPKINNVDRIFGVLIASHQEVVGFDISVDDSLFMHNFDSLNHLHCNVQH